MKKSLIIPLIIFSTIFLISCGQNTSNAPNNQNENSTAEDTSNNKVNDKTETSNPQNNNDTNTNQSSKKDSYIEVCSCYKCILQPDK
jgi:flagellar basal body-associated protein FliL